MVDDGIEERVGEIIRTHFSNGAVGVANPRPNRLEDIELGFLLESDEKMFAEKHADLFAAHLASLVAVNHVGDDEKVIIVLLDLRALAGVQNVFERERVKIELRTQNPQDFNVPQPVDVDPGDALIVE